VIVLAGLPDRDDAWQPVAVAYSEAAGFSAPQMIPSPAGRLLVIGGIKASNGEDAAAVYLFNQGSLQMIDSKTWLGTLQSRLPDGLDLSRPIVPDYAKLQAIATVTRSQSSCCPTGAKATIDLAIEDDRVAVEGVNFDGPQSPSSSETNEDNGRAIRRGRSAPRAHGRAR
jgi:hypothetical protein